MTKIYRKRERKREIELQLTQANPAGSGRSGGGHITAEHTGALCRQKPQKDPNNLTEEEEVS